MKTCYSCSKSFVIPNDTYTQSILMCRPTENSPMQETGTICPDYEREAGADERCVVHGDGDSY